MRLHSGFAMIGTLLTLAACTATPATGPAPAAHAEDPACHGRMVSAGRIRAGDNLQLALFVKNTGRRCWTGFGFSGTSMLGSQLVNPPAHGNALVHAGTNGLAVGYLPATGYVGSDTFVIDVPTGYGLRSNLDFQVTVVP